jgi:natural product precursor
MKTKKAAAPRMTLHRETLRRLSERQLEQVAGGFTHTCNCTGGTGVTCSGWPPCTC